ncbi:retropepsin-like aspartic protease family protein [Sphingorhabdus sp.]|jgi:aspartyl protease family protein|uniref:retropepsin-like aspartic protease family protein n=1 Tax=Sphingorhabdus sp. TaxID=1902408 RepID=UPI003BAF9AC6|nr:TIGR02281 family clan AA aspartic protease [Sphingomonadales bacterium]MBL0022999.1 TIGR02281 family clan AA aspartic protease [Sphingomonadales bacterium]
MTSDDNARLIYGLMLIGLMVASLAARRLPLKQYAKMILAWIAIFAVAFAIMSFRPEMKMAWNRISGELTGAPRQTMQGDAIQLVRQDDGHFWMRAQLNGHQTDLMIDSGATTTAINSDTARGAMLTLDPVEESVELSTANGIVKARTASVEVVSIGELAIDDLDVVVSDGFGDTNVAGMNFLDLFDSWNVKGDVMTLKP